MKHPLQSRHGRVGWPWYGDEKEESMQRYVSPQCIRGSWHRMNRRRLHLMGRPGWLCGIVWPSGTSLSPSLSVQVSSS
ncbi:hypothetical protein DAEQUDRAFT_414541 [Daedalea quercina L-15889]|uniref:Uncharacterized protein n=1 Tax=Daedalea quercina L-15889 TaxID=1314783 RepID=A0A165THW5_9APHY|nr:hypothetical protein DAEQUDRAFT_414541 [Daedalea quercina L-15889]